MELQMFFIVLTVTITVTSCTVISKNNFKSFIDKYNDDNSNSIEELTKGNNKDKLKESVIKEGNRLIKEASDRPVVKYEVTEHIVDIPNNETNFGPIVTNYTDSIPLKNATINQTQDIKTKKDKAENISDSNEDTGTVIIKNNYKPFIDKYYKDNSYSTEVLTNENYLKESIIKEGNRLIKEASDRPAVKYEVTEHIVDIPNKETNFGPIFTNYTVSIPLNNATIMNQTRDKPEEDKKENISNSNEDTGTVIIKNNYKPFIDKYYEDNSDTTEELTKENDLKESIIKEGNRLIKEASDRPAVKNEVIEHIVDIPNNETNFGPIVTNYTVSIPLHNTTINQTQDIKIKEDKEEYISNSIEDTDEEYYYDDDDNLDVYPNGLGSKLPAKASNTTHRKQQQQKSTAIDFNSFIKDAKSDFNDFVKGAKKGIVDGVSNVIYNIHKEVTKNDIGAGFSKIITVPYWILKKLFTKLD